MNETVVGLALGGAAFEVIGLFLVVKEIATDRQKARELLRVDVTVHPATIRSQAQVLTLSVSGGEKQSVEDRLDNVERRLANLAGETIPEIKRELIREIDSQVSTRVNELGAEIVAKDRALRDFLSAQLTGRIARRVWGVILLFIGIALSAAANVVGAT